MSRIVLIHGSVADGPTAWSSQVPLEDSYEVVILERPGSRPGDDIEPMTYADHAEWVASRLKRGDHVVGCSTGGIIAMLAAASATADLGSLCVLEPPALSHAVDDADVARMSTALQDVWTRRAAEPRDFLVEFFEAFAGEAPPLPSPLPPALEHGARRLQLEQGPWEVVVPTAELAARRIPTMVMTGGWSAAMDAVAQTLATELGATTQVKAGAGHDIQHADRFNEALERFVSAASRDRR